jgi:uncharacterized membrane protein
MSAIGLNWIASSIAIITLQKVAKRSGLRAGWAETVTVGVVMCGPFKLAGCVRDGFFIVLVLT